MKNIITIISALFLIAGLILLDTFLSDGDMHLSLVTNQEAYNPVSTQLGNEKTASLPSDRCNGEKELEGSHVVHFQFATVRKVFLRHIAFAPLSVLNGQLVTGLSGANKFQLNSFTYSINSIPLHIRNCVWII